MRLLFLPYTQTSGSAQLRDQQLSAGDEDSRNEQLGDGTDR